ncbi:MAG: PEP-CTERM sorting domain-containing protein [Proteobacteria bacterium]|nr:PEP-CTERM sorting domain-containing protein [Pseudomonadota bacterium]
MRKLLPIAGAVALALPLLAHATTTINFDPDGSGGLSAVQVDLLDWKPGNAIAVGGGGLTNGQTTQLLYQANLGITSLNGVTNSTSGQGGASFLTAVAGFKETAAVGTVGSSAVATFTLASPNVLSSTNFFYIYANTGGNDLSGKGFATGKLIFSGHVSSMNSSNFSANTTGAQALDQFGTNNYAGQQSLVGSGASDITVTIDFADQSYFPGLQAGALSFSFFNASQVTPFKQADPSALFSSNGLLDGDYTHNLNTINGFSNGNSTQDFQFQADANQSFNALVIPEPGTIALVGIALAGLGVASRRRRS